jgi:hypothetical protein
MHVNTRILLSRIFYPLLVALLCLIPVYVSQAQTVLRSQEQVKVSDTQIVEGDFYSLGSSINVSGTVSGDWLGIGNTITGNGVFAEDVLLVGRSVQLHGSTTDDVRVSGLEVTIADHIGGDLVIVADSAKILSSASIAGDVVLFANSVEINAPVEGDIVGSVGSLRVDGSVAGNVDVTAESLVLGGAAIVKNNVRYESPNTLERAQDSVVEGEVQYQELSYQVEPLDRVRDYLMFFLAILFVTLVGFLLTPRRLGSVVTSAIARFSLNALIGFAVLVTVPVLITVFVASGLGVLVGVALFAFYVLLLIIGLTLSGPICGVLFMRYVFSRRIFDLLTIISGVAVLYGVALIPLLGPALVLITVSAGMGAVLVRLLQNRG